MSTTERLLASMFMIMTAGLAFAQEATSSDPHFISLLQAAVQGDAKAQYDLGFLLRTGVIAKDGEEAVRCFMESEAGTVVFAPITGVLFSALNLDEYIGLRTVFDDVGVFRGWRRDVRRADVGGGGAVAQHRNAGAGACEAGVIIRE